MWAGGALIPELKRNEVGRQGQGCWPGSSSVLLQRDTEVDKETVAVATAAVTESRQSLLDTPMGSREGCPPAPFSLLQSCERPQRKAQGLGWPPGSQPNPLLMSGQPEGLGPWPQPCNPGSPSQAELGAGQPQGLGTNLPPAQHTHLTHTPRPDSDRARLTQGPSTG